jgi:large subunit ribosomal protein L14e
VDKGRIGPVPGQIVQVLRGRDHGRHAVIVEVLDDRYVKIADGDRRSYDQAKRKNLLHLQLLNEVSPEVAESLRETGRVTNGKLRHALARYQNNRGPDAQPKGE